MARLVKLGYTVWTPFGDNARRADILIEKESAIKRVQCKTGRLDNGAVGFRTVSVHKSKSGFYHRSYAGEVDYFAVYCPENEQVYLVPIGSVPTGQAFLRVSESANNQKKRVRWARDFVI